MRTIHHRSFSVLPCGLCDFAGHRLPPNCKGRRVLLTIAAIFLAAAHAFAQSNLDDLRNKIANGSVEDKRNALLEVRNLSAEDASRIAIPALNDRDELVRAAAPSAVAFLPKPEAARLILPLLNDKAEFVRSEAAFALGEVGDSSAVQPLLQRLQKDSGAVRSVAAAALGKIGDVSAVGALNALLKRKPNEDDENLRRSAARSIGQIARFVRTGKRRVETPQNFLPTKYKDSYSATESVVHSFPVFRSSVTILTIVLSNKKEADDVRREAAFALGAIGDISVRQILSDHLNSSDIYLAEICTEALLNLSQFE
ncbi:MAG: HEAT repeat domain-containing protein [Chloracidobacterium sp.]|nr:HEAT repeat domain-containing protein [Chloracidobacterium sp.]